MEEKQLKIVGIKERNEALVKEYSQKYPKNKIFYITTDGYIFLENAKSLALEHQKKLDGKLVTIKIK